MKKFAVFLSAIAMIGCLAGCGYSSTSEPVEDKIVVNTSATKATPDVSHKNSTPVNYMDEIKAEIHDELFREETDETLDIVDRIFKHMSIETVESFVEGDDASVQMNITTINAGKAWVVGMERYAIACAENLFAENYDDDATLYSYYLDEFESCVRRADYITMPVIVEMDYHNHRWEWDLDDDVVNAITGQLLAAIEGELNSSNVVIIPEVEDDGPSAEPEKTNPTEPERNDTTTTVGMENAAEAAASYLKWSSYSRVELKQALERDGYTEAEIEYALKSIGY